MWACGPRAWGWGGGGIDGVYCPAAPVGTPTECATTPSMSLLSSSVHIFGQFVDARTSSGLLKLLPSALVRAHRRLGVGQPGNRFRFRIVSRVRARRSCARVMKRCARTARGGSGKSGVRPGGRCPVACVLALERCLDGAGLVLGPSKPKRWHLRVDPKLHWGWAWQV